MAFLFFAITGWTGAVVALLLPIQMMKFYQRTGLGYSATFMGGPRLQMLPHGFCQVYEAAPACWTMLGTVLMHCYQQEGFGAQVMAPISQWILEFLGTMFLDHTDSVAAPT